MPEMARPDARTAMTELGNRGCGAGAGSKVARARVRVGGMSAFACEGNVVALELHLADVVGNEKVGEVGALLDGDAGAVLHLPFAGLLDSTPDFDSHDIIELRVLAQGGTAPYTRGGW